jgi:hypothetical protein
VNSHSRIVRAFILTLILVIIFPVKTIYAQNSTGGVTLTPSHITWKTLAYKLDENNAVVSNSLDTKTVIEQTFDTYILENDYLKVTLLPALGGRILSIIYKPTGHEELYQNPLGVPYGIGDGNFYYDWLMVYGGIFPTFPEPEHGKTWLLPWDFKVITETPEEITVAMSIVDNFAFNRAPDRFDTGITGIEAVFYITLKAGRAALDTRITLHNPGDKQVRYEYWTCTTLAPGSELGDPHVTAGAEIIAPIDIIKMPPWWPDTTAQEKRSSAPDTYTFDNLRLFKNWVDMGIVYANPSMGGRNFWGVINHDNEEGLIRISTNDVTSGLKMWTWGYDSVKIDPFTQPTEESRPYIEMWAGVTPEFFNRTTLAPDAEVEIHETYSPTVGMSNISQTSRDYLAHFFAEQSHTVHLQLFSIQPERKSRAVIMADEKTIYEMPVLLDPLKASQIDLPIPEGTKTLSYKILGEDNTELLKGELPLE